MYDYVEHDVSIVKWWMHSTWITITCLASHAVTISGTWGIYWEGAANYLNVQLVSGNTRIVCPLYKDYYSGL